MSDNNSGNNTGILVAAVIGAAVGAGIALLFAPRSGGETRTWLASRAQDLKSTTVKAVEQGKASLQRAAKDIEKDAESIAATLRT